MPPRRAKSPSARSNEKQTNLSAFDVSADDGSLLHNHFGEATAAPAPTNKKGGGILSELSSVFLPEGYPHSVRPEYFRFQCYDTLQAACSYLRNILTTAAILRGSGVGDAEAWRQLLQYGLTVALGGASVGDDGEDCVTDTLLTDEGRCTGNADRVMSSRLQRSRFA